jgi:hypothetical protein
MESISNFLCVVWDSFGETKIRFDLTELIAYIRILIQIDVVFLQYQAYKTKTDEVPTYCCVFSLLYIRRRAISDVLYKIS